MYAKDGRNELAIQYLRKALEEGLKEKKKLNEEPEFAGLRELPEFKELLTLVLSIEAQPGHWAKSQSYIGFPAGSGR